MSKKEDACLQGLCKECTHRNSCKDAKRHLNMISCSEYKYWKKKNYHKEDLWKKNIICKKC